MPLTLSNKRALSFGNWRLITEKLLKSILSSEERREVSKGCDEKCHIRLVLRKQLGELTDRPPFIEKKRMNLDNNSRTSSVCLSVCKKTSRHSKVSKYARRIGTAAALWKRFHFIFLLLACLDSFLNQPINEPFYIDSIVPLYAAAYRYMAEVKREETDSLLL